MPWKAPNPGHIGEYPLTPPLSSPPAAALHVLTLTPFYPSLENEVSGCFIKEPLDCLEQMGIVSGVIAVSPIYHHRRRASPQAPAMWVRYPQVPGTLGLSGAGRFLYARLLRAASRLHRMLPISVIHAHGALPCGHAAGLLARHLGIPYVVTVHGQDVFNTCYLEGAPAQRRRDVSARVYRDANAVICISGKVQQILTSGIPTGVRSVVVYNGTDAELFSPDKPEGDSQKVVLSVGNLIPTKGQELVLRAIGRIASSFPGLEYWIIGEGPERARLESLARELAIGPQVHFLGRQNRAAVADAMRRCSVFALPSSNEGLGCVYLEAMACARPAIACRGQGIDEVIDHGKNGWLVSPDGLDELVQGLSTLLSSTESSLQIGLAARQTVRDRLTLRHQALELVRIYREVSTPASAPKPENSRVPNPGTRL